ncbi:MAG: rhodanese-related sulfurtransferase [Chlamydiota bacterium]
MLRESIMAQYLVLSFYLLEPIANPDFEVKRFHRFFADKDIKGRIYISREGVNAQMSVREEEAPLFYDWLAADPRFAAVDIKVQMYDGHAFPKMTVKYRKQLVALDCEIDLSLRGDYLSPKEWAEKLDQRNAETLVLDVRNDYEWDVGHFEGAKRPACKTFREFPVTVERIKAQYDREKTQIMMSCTGGIRCELYSCLLKRQGFKHVYQLKGGVINYGLEVGTKHWKGELFVFDDRLVVPLSTNQKSTVIGKCSICTAKTRAYYNCANMDCNQLFLSCSTCIQKQRGCCSKECIEAPRRRKFVFQSCPKPFKKLSFEEKTKYCEP